MNLEEFLKEVDQSPRNYRNLWIEEGPLKAYCRYVAHHMINGRIRICFDLATVEVEEKEQRKGHFKNFLQKLEHLVPHPIRAENVQNEHLVKYLEKQGYEKINDHSPIPSFYKEVK